MDRAQRGKDAEKRAEKLLKTAGCKVISRNYSCRYGEIDLIVQQSDTLIFVEVRYRNNQRYGGAASSVNFHKQQRIIKTAQYFLCQNKKYADATCRFDVLAFEAEEAGSQPLWYKDAFRA